MNNINELVFFNNMVEFKENINLDSLRGKKLKKILRTWDNEIDDWYENYPNLFLFDDTMYSVYFNNLGEFSFTETHVDAEQNILHEETTLGWKEYELEGLKNSTVSIAEVYPLADSRLIGSFVLYFKNGTISINKSDENYTISMSIAPFSEKVIELGIKFDEAHDNQDVNKIQKLIKDAIDHLEFEDTNISKSHLCYSIATSYQDLFLYNNIEREESLSKQLYYFRTSLNLLGKEKDVEKKYLIYYLTLKKVLLTNYAIAINHTGRTLQAIFLYKEIIKFQPDFGMALGNLGTAFIECGNRDYDEGHRALLYSYAYSLLNKSVLDYDPNTTKEAKEIFKQWSDILKFKYSKDVLSGKIDDFDKNINYSKKEQKYRIWCVKNKLFINTLNELTDDSLLCANDVLHLPNMTVKIYEKPTLHGIFNEIKQNFIYSRYLFYSSLNERKYVHFADKETHLVDIYDYSKYSIRIENIKSAYKNLYGLFDRIAFFINYYFELNIKDRDISFYKIWSQKIIDKLDIKNNSALEALYWIKKDLFDKIDDSPNPELKMLKDIRNALEHRYTKVIEDWAFEEDEYDDLSFYITEKDLIKNTLDLLHIVRETIIYLSQSVYLNEINKNNDKSNSISVVLDQFDDEWKI